MQRENFYLGIMVKQKKEERKERKQQLTADRLGFKTSNNSNIMNELLGEGVDGEKGVTSLILYTSHVSCKQVRYKTERLMNVTYAIASIISRPISMQQ